MIDSTFWTISYRKPRANRFQRATDVATSWQGARDLARQVAIAHPELEVWVNCNRAAELAGYVGAEDIGNILSNNDARVRVVDNGSLASLNVEGL